MCWSLGGPYMVFYLRLRKICRTLSSANFGLLEKLSFGSQELPKKVLNLGVTFKIRSALKMKLHGLEFDLGRGLQNGRMQQHLGCW